MITSTETVYLHTDHLDTPRLATGTSGTVKWRWDADAFGVGSQDTDPDNDSTDTYVNLRFPGQYYDDESDKHYNYFRDYDVATGRYVESDPIGLEGGVNRFGYVEAKPESAVDPYGLRPLFPGEPDLFKNPEAAAIPYEPTCYTEQEIVAWCAAMGISEEFLAAPGEQLVERAAESLVRELAEETAARAAGYLVGRGFALAGIIDHAIDIPDCIRQLKETRLCDTEEECEIRETRRILNNHLSTPTGAF